MQELNVANSYQRFEAIKGNKTKETNTKTNLSNGEIGIWKSWIKILETESRNNSKDYKYLHIIEDDIILGQDLYKMIGRIANNDITFDILITDMYVNPPIYKELSKEYRRLIRNEKYAISTDFYSGCLSSVIIPNEKISYIYNELTKYYEIKQQDHIPIDNFIKRLKDRSRITIGVTIPFLTTIETNSIRKSTIQEREQEKEAITISQEICTILRQDLSILRKGNTNKKLIDAIIKLNNVQINPSLKEKNDILISRKLIEFLEENRAMEYKVQPRLMNEKDNDQAANKI